MVRIHLPPPMIEIYYENRIRILDKLSPSLVAELKEEFEHKNPVYYKLRARNIWPPKTEPAVISTWRLEQTGLSFPKGGLARIEKILGRHKVEYKVVYPAIPSYPDHIGAELCIRPYDYQQRCIDAVCHPGGNIGLIKAPTGSGKSLTGVAIAATLDIPFLIVVHSTALLKQWMDRIRAAFQDAVEVGIIQGKKFELKPLTIGMAQTLTKLPDSKWNQINTYFGGVIQDEVQFSAARSFINVIDKCGMPYRIGLSADHTRKDKKEFLIYDLFGGVIKEINKEDLVNREFVHDVSVVMEPTEFEAEWFFIQRKANDLRNDHKSFDEIYSELRKHWPGITPQEVPFGNPDYSRLIGEMGESDCRNTQILDLVEKYTNAGHHTFVFAHRIDHCTGLVSKIRALGIECGLLLGGPENKAEFQRTIAGIDNGTIKVGVGTWQALGTGIDCPRVSRGIMCTPINGKQIWNQIRGRQCRRFPGKKDSEITYLWDRKVFFDSPVKNMNSWNNDCKIWIRNSLVSSRDYLREKK